jgi:hypothetical protein
MRNSSRKINLKYILNALTRWEMHYNAKYICVRVSNAAIEIRQSPSFVLFLTFVFQMTTTLTTTQSP